MWFKYPLLILALLLLGLLQSSFLAYFGIMGIVPNLIFIVFFTVIFFESKHTYEFGFWAAIISGFFVDIVFGYYFGISIGVMLSIYLLHKTTVHFFKETRDRFSIFYFIPIFLAFLVIYHALLYVILTVLRMPINMRLDVSFIVLLMYNLIFALAAFYLYRNLAGRKEDENQLTLL